MLQKLKLSLTRPAVSTLTLAFFLILIPFERWASSLRLILLWATLAAWVIEHRDAGTHGSARGTGISRKQWLVATVGTLAGLSALTTLSLWLGRGTGTLWETLQEVFQRGLPVALVAPPLIGALRTCRKNANPAGFDRWLWLALGGFALWVVFTSCFSLDPNVSFRYIFKEAGPYFLLYLVFWGKLAERSENAGRWILWMVLISGLIGLCAVLIYVCIHLMPAIVGDTLDKAEWIRRDWIGNGRRMARVQFPFVEHNRLSSYLLTGLVLTPVALMMERRRWVQFSLYILAGGLFLGIAASGTRGAMIAALPVIGIIAAIRIRPIMIVSMVVLIGFVWMLAPATSRMHLGNIFEPETYLNPAGSIKYRYRAWEDTMRMIGDRPLLGLGYGWPIFEQVYPEYSGAATEKVKPHAHNNLLQVSVETGLVGLVLFGMYQISLLLGTVWPPGRATRSWSARSALLAVWVGLFLYGLTNYSMRRTVGFVVWLDLALLHFLIVGAAVEEGAERQSYEIPQQNA